MGFFSSTIDCTTLTRVKSMLNKPDDDTTDDVVLPALITGLSAQIEEYLCRPLASQTFAEEHDIEPNQMTLYTRAFPITAFTSIKTATNRNFSSGETLSTDLYWLNSRTGEIHLTSPLRAMDESPGLRSTYPLLAQVNYTAGMATSTAALIASFPNVALAADLYVCAVWKRKDDPGATVQRAGQDSYTRLKELAMPEIVASMLFPEVRRRMNR